MKSIILVSSFLIQLPQGEHPNGLLKVKVHNLWNKLQLLRLRARKHTIRRDQLRHMSVKNSLEMGNIYQTNTTLIISIPAATLHRQLQ